ncbi:MULTISPECIES: hypothetical protein [Calothrix]|uniref:Uncharacterized protein n=2 Tax=Calothrix TaxID=1186 RepID=A0ABR8AP17_9CYAN|nr:MULTISPECIES: hypothetical protein [Calothrix]MBD2200362.1 hypothetical protein [Calothrix parietina FACHB-288]MBD2229004.1 hypothetical protein [Calothrix anomala FACHB-343]
MSAIRCLTFLLVLMLSLTVALPATAAVCQNYHGHRVCILSIERSAKNYWEYKASVSVDDVKEPTKVYNCRSQVKILKDGTFVPFGDKDPGELICRFFKR